MADLISASGQAAADSAYTALSGALRQKIEGALDILMEVSAGMAAWVDYPDQEIPELSGDTLLKSLQQAQGLLSHLLAGYDNGQLMTAGVDTVIVGRPNVGKSALMNDLTGQETSIVTAVQGTTRDVVERTVRLGDLTLRLADTAGLRQTDDVVEQIGVERAQARLQQARLVLAVFDGSTPLTSADEELMTLCKGKTAVAVVNKNDLPPAAVKKSEPPLIGWWRTAPRTTPVGTIWLWRWQTPLGCRILTRRIRSLPTSDSGSAAKRRQTVWRRRWPRWKAA